MRLISLIVLTPIAFYDFLTSLIGGYALFSLKPTGAVAGHVDLFLHGIPWTLAAGSVVLNYWTFPVWRATGQGLRLLRLPWIAFLLYDYYTTFLGVSCLLERGELLAFRFRSITTVIAAIGGEQVLVAAVISCIIVLTPMMCHVIKNIDA